MKPRHAAALALIGWYLIWPPPVTPRSPGASTAPPNDAAPLSQWTIWKSYNSEQTCEAAKKQSQDTAKANLDKQLHFDEKRQGLSPDNLSDTGFLVTDQLAYATKALCVSADDPRLKRN